MFEEWLCRRRRELEGLRERGGGETDSERVRVAFGRIGGGTRLATSKRVPEAVIKKKGM